MVSREDPDITSPSRTLIPGRQSPGVHVLVPVAPDDQQMLAQRAGLRGLKHALIECHVTTKERNQFRSPERLFQQLPGCVTRGTEKSNHLVVGHGLHRSQWTSRWLT